MARTRRSLHRGRGLKLVVTEIIKAAIGRSLHRGRGLKRGQNNVIAQCRMPVAPCIGGAD